MILCSQPGNIHITNYKVRIYLHLTFRAVLWDFIQIVMSMDESQFTSQMWRKSGIKLNLFACPPVLIDLIIHKSLQTYENLVGKILLILLYINLVVICQVFPC